MSQLSDVAIYNLAMGWLAANPIVSFTEDKNEAALGLMNYEALRNALLAEHQWGFAQKRAVLPPLVSVPPWGYSCEFQVPADALAINYVGQSGRIEEDDSFANWAIEGDKIRVGAATGSVISGYCRYTSIVDDPVKFPELFAQALAARVAVDLAMPLTESVSTMQVMAKMYASKLSVAIIEENKQGRARVVRAKGMLVARRSGSSSIGPEV